MPLSIEINGANLNDMLITREVVDRVLAYEKLDRQLALTVTQHETQQQRQAVMEAAYRTGDGSTSQMLTVWQRAEDIAARLEEQRITQTQYRQQLESLTQGNWAIQMDDYNGVVP